MKVNFIGGDDVQRSLNHSDNLCINLIPALNDNGEIAAYYNAPGLELELTNPSSAVGSGIYTASNGRCFEVAGTTLYELTETAGVISTTSRGTVTAADIYRMSDNGIELILVNGIDGWLFTFATNTLTQIKALSDTFTVTIANPAVFTQTAHGLVAGDAIRLTTTTGSILSDTILSNLSPATVIAGSVAKQISITGNGDFVYTSKFSGFPYYPMSYISDMLSSPVPAISQFTRGTNGLISALSPTYAEFGLFGSAGNYTAAAYAGNIVFSSDGISAYLTCTAVNNSVGSLYAALAQFDANSTTGDLTCAAYAQAGATFVIGSAPATTIPQCVNVCISHDDEYVYAINDGNQIYQFSRNLGTGDLSALTPSYVSTGTSPQEMVISTDGLFAYCTNKTGNTITMFSRNATTGLLTSVSATSCEGLSPTGLALSPDTNNPFLYVINNGSNEIEVFSRNSTTGAITHVASSSIATGTSPQKIIATAESVYVTNSGSNTVSMFTRNTSTGLLTATSTPTIATESAPIGIAISPDGNSVYVCNSGASSISQYSRNATADYVGLPTGLQELTTYYVISAGLTADNFEVSETEGGTAVATSGQQAGVHTYTTLGYGFPEGAKTVSYMNGRFVALEPNTQNFFVSEVLDGNWWDALNVQTVDSNPDNVVGETVSHNELIVFCDDSGEVFYDSGETPSPFVRNTSGTFEVGCVAPYSICNLDNQVFWLGGNKNGAGIVYKLQGFTPIRISTHSIEQAIQSMTDITDARAYSYQQDGHHYYVLNFPTGNKTYCYDVNTGLWHQRADYAAGSFSRLRAVEHAYFAGKNLILGTDGKVYSFSPDVYSYGSDSRKCLRSFKVPTQTMDRVRHNRMILDCEVGQSSGGTITGGEVSSVSIINAGDSGDPEHSWTAGTLPAAESNMAVGHNGSYFCAFGSDGNTAISTDGVTWTAGDTVSGIFSEANIAWNGAIWCVTPSSSSRTTFTSSDGLTWTTHTNARPSIYGSYRSLVLFQGAFYCSGYSAASTISIYKSTDGINWGTVKSQASNSTNGRLITDGTVLIVFVSNSGDDYCLSSTDGTTWTYTNAAFTAGDYYCGAGNGTILVALRRLTTSFIHTADGVTWTAGTLPSAVAWDSVVYDAAMGGFYAVATDSNQAAISADGLTWTAASVASANTGWSSIASSGTRFCAVPYTGSTVAAVSTYGYPLAGTYAMTFTGGGGSAAAGTYTISSSTGMITSTAMTNNGSGYTSTPTVTFIYGGITGATGEANMSFTYSSSSEASIPVGMRYSDDAGRSWSAIRYGYLSNRGVVWHRLGMTKGLPRIYEISTIDNEKVTLLNVHLD